MAKQNMELIRQFTKDHMKRVVIFKPLLDLCAQYVKDTNIKSLSDLIRSALINYLESQGVEVSNEIKAICLLTGKPRKERISKTQKLLDEIERLKAELEKKNNV